MATSALVTDISMTTATTKISSGTTRPLPLYENFRRLRPPRNVAGASARGGDALAGADHSVSFFVVALARGR